MVDFGDSYITFLYVEKQLKYNELFCCMPMTVIYVFEYNGLGIDTTFKMCNMYITDTPYYKKQLLSRKIRKNPVHLGHVMMHFNKAWRDF